MEAIDGAGKHDQWLHTIQELSRPGRNISTSIDARIDKCLMCVIEV